MKNSKKSKELLTEVVIYLTEDYSKNESIWVDCGLREEEIFKIVNERFETWYYYDII